MELNGDGLCSGSYRNLSSSQPQPPHRHTDLEADKKSTTTPALEHPNPPFAHPMRWMPRAAAIHVSPAFLTEEFVVRPYHAALFQCASTEGRRADRLLKIATVSGDRELVRADSPLLRYFGFRAFARTDVASVHRGSR
mmetsp:Transcript_34909/g.107769  ORF Transcript_34909/g.107769 Transcript_34909/m.107769 type:complete len:138 (-) Transcript_34909:103-516(-)